ncbi:hypothetical protein [Nocardia thraciensis]
MPHNTSGDSDQWSEPGDPVAADLSGDLDLGAGTGRGPGPVLDDTWLVSPSAPGREPSRPPARRRGVLRRIPLRGWAGLAAVAAVTVGVIAGVRGPHHPADSGPGAVTASPGTSASVPGSVAEGACAGLTGAVVTDRAGDPATVAGVIATFQDAYYTLRSAEAAVKVVAPESGITEGSLADGIATIPKGTRYCVAITPVTLNTAHVHIVETRPDRTRVDYLQVVNTISTTGGGLLISHVQGQG